MNIIEKHDIKRVLRYAIIMVVILILIPLIPYYLKVGKTGLSNDPDKWGVFGDYFGGVIGSIFSAVAAVLALVSVFFSIKIAAKVQSDEHRFNLEAAKRENERFQKEIELTHKQNKPYPYMDLIKLDNITKIVLHNYGTGPMLVSQSHLLYDNNEIFPHFVGLVKQKMQTRMKDTVINYNSAPTHILPPNGSKDLLEIIPKNEPTADFKRVQAECRELLVKCQMFMTYEDIFENKSETVFLLSFFNNV
jgi:uncharacterized membrane protein